MFQVGNVVKIKEPFSSSFPDEYEIIDIVNNYDETIVYILSNGAGGFDAKFLELV